MTRQQLRKALTFVSFIALPVTLFYFSPVIIVMAGSSGIICGSFLIFVTLFVASLFLQRSFCGWLCPLAGMQDNCKAFTNKNITKFNWVKLLVWIPWILTIIVLAVKAGGYHKIDVFHLTENGFSVSEKKYFLPYFIVLGVIFIMALIWGRRAFCHYLCWIAPFMIIGSKIGRFFRLPQLILSTTNSNNCTDCGRCSKACPMGLDVKGMVSSEELNHSECTLCGECVDSCREKVIKYSFRRINK